MLEPFRSARREFKAASVPKDSHDDDLERGLSDYSDDLAARRVAAEVESRYAGLIRGVPERHREWIRRVAAAANDPELPRRRRRDLARFLDRVGYRPRTRDGGLIPAVMSFVDAVDYEKHPWEDDSEYLTAAHAYCDWDMTALLLDGLECSDARARTTAVKWLPRHVRGLFAVPLLERRLPDTERNAAWWAAIHLSRLAPKTAGLPAVLREALQTRWISSSRLAWQFGLTGAGEAAVALGLLGADAREAIPDLLRVDGGPDWPVFSYDGRLAAQAVWRIAGGREGLLNLLAATGEDPAAADRIENTGLSPWSSACFVSEFLEVGKEG
jgi:hypothetical protein